MQLSSAGRAEQEVEKDPLLQVLKQQMEMMKHQNETHKQMVEHQNETHKQMVRQQSDAHAKTMEHVMTAVGWLSPTRSRPREHGSQGSNAMALPEM
eukprot:SAG11_NODE_21471_length_424_cov_1.261538_1_plen_95_part_01